MWEHTALRRIGQDRRNECWTSKPGVDGSTASAVVIHVENGFQDGPRLAAEATHFETLNSGERR